MNVNISKNKLNINKLNDMYLYVNVYLYKSCLWLFIYIAT